MFATPTLRALGAGGAAGVISALAFVSATTGLPLVQLVLFLVAPLPIYLVGLAFGPAGSIGAGLAGGLFLTSISGGLTVPAVFVLSQAVPAGVLTSRALLHRDAPQNPDGREWYPVGRLVVWAGTLAASISAGMLLVVGQSAEALKSALRKSLADYVEATMPKSGGAALSDADLDRLTDVTLALLPPVAAMMIMLCLLLNLWLAASLLHASGQLQRPWPDIAAFTLPAGAPLALGALIIAASVLEGVAGLVAAAAAGAIYLAFVLLGLAILHYVSRGKAWRTPILWAAYLALVIFNTGFSLLLAVIGLTEPIAPWRRGPPPAARPPPQT
ncbi:MAG: DUF2232 domain-containing protein [Hyphomicrobiaceae bacterium]|nr:DUF2232 domain-containing protein [Hyphomicrobiaceae bacterium]